MLVPPVPLAPLALQVLKVINTQLRNSGWRRARWPCCFTPLRCRPETSGTWWRMLPGLVWLLDGAGVVVWQCCVE